MFKPFQFWLYTGNIFEAPEHSASPEDHRTLTNLYIFGEARGVPGLQNAATDAVIDQDQKSHILYVTEIRHVCDNSSEKSPMRRLYVDMMIGSLANLRDPGWGIGTSTFIFGAPLFAPYIP